jgi:alkanesulfonate monooxygenase SsuD/methylene tetrahydromethanopterin reductase-like flavin-dependent oxidoreductase (luciferase family)
MVHFGYTLMTEQAGPRELVRFAAEAERAGFDFEVMSDHYFPWLDEQGTRRTRGACSARSPR